MTRSLLAMTSLKSQTTANIILGTFAMQCCTVLNELLSVRKSDNMNRASVLKTMIYAQYALLFGIAYIGSDNIASSLTLNLGFAILGIYAQSTFLSKAHEHSASEHFISSKFTDKPRTNEFVELIGSYFLFICAATTPQYLLTYFRHYTSPHDLNPDVPVKLNEKDIAVLKVLSTNDSDDLPFSATLQNSCKKALGLSPSRIHSKKEVSDTFKARARFWHPDKPHCKHRKELCTEQFQTMQPAKEYLLKY